MFPTFCVIISREGMDEDFLYLVQVRIEKESLILIQVFLIFQSLLCYENQRDK